MRSMWRDVYIAIYLYVVRERVRISCASYVCTVYLRRAERKLMPNRDSASAFTSIYQISSFRHFKFWLIRANVMLQKRWCHSICLRFSLSRAQLYEFPIHATFYWNNRSNACHRPGVSESNEWNRFSVSQVFVRTALVWVMKRLVWWNNSVSTATETSNE